MRQSRQKPAKAGFCFISTRKTVMSPLPPIEHRAVRKFNAVKSKIDVWLPVVDAAHMRAPLAEVFVQGEAFLECFNEYSSRTGLQTIDELVDEFGFETMAAIFEATLTWGTWRLTKGIYRIDSTVYESLINTPLEKGMPVEAIAHLPQWCIYVETPGLFFGSRDGTQKTPLYGVWARRDELKGEKLLIVAPDIDEEDQIFPQQISVRLQHDTDLVDTPLEEQTKCWLPQVINCLIYLCAKPEYSRGEAIEKPQNPAPKKVKKGIKFFPPQTSTVWDVSVRLGAAIRAAYSRETVGAGVPGHHSSPRAHIRSGHFHTFYTGKRKNEEGERIPKDKQGLEVKWLPPIPVNVEDIESLPATIRVVK
jgi:hypothetical protein